MFSFKFSDTPDKNDEAAPWKTVPKLNDFGEIPDSHLVFDVKSITLDLNNSSVANPLVSMPIAKVEKTSSNLEFCNTTSVKNIATHESTPPLTPTFFHEMKSTQTQTQLASNDFQARLRQEPFHSMVLLPFFNLVEVASLPFPEQVIKVHSLMCHSIGVQIKNIQLLTDLDFFQKITMQNVLKQYSNALLFIESYHQKLNSSIKLSPPIDFSNNNSDYLVEDNPSVFNIPRMYV